MRTTGPRDRAAIAAWVEKQDVDGADDVLPSLPSLQTGEAWAWNPERSLLQRTRIRLASTFDSGATPKAGTAARTLELAPIDLTALGAEIQATAERAKANDPAALRKELQHERRYRQDLERSLEQLQQEIRAASEPQPLIVETSVISDAELEEQLDRFRDMKDLATSAIARADDAIRTGTALARRLRALPPAAQGEPEDRERSRRAAAAPTPPARPAPPAPAARPADPPAGVSGPQQRILNAIAVLEQLGVSAPEKVQVALIAEASPRSSAFANNLGALRNQLGLIDYPAGGRVQLTDPGRELADPGAAPRTVEEMHRFVAGLVGRAKWRLLEQLIAVYPYAMDKAELADRAGASTTSSAFANNLGALRNGFALIDYPGPGQVVALPILFLEA